MDKIIKFKNVIEYGIGTLRENPEKFGNKETKFTKLFWIKYDGYWYLTKLLIERGEDKIFINKLKNNCYNREQLEEYILAVIV